MRQSLLAAAFINAATLSLPAGPLRAQPLSSVYDPNPLPLGKGFGFAQRIQSTDPGYDGAITCRVPAGNYGAVTVAKTTPGPLKNLIEIADKISPDGRGHIATSGVTYSGEAGKFPAVLRNRL